MIRFKILGFRIIFIIKRILIFKFCHTKHEYYDKHLCVCILWPEMHIKTVPDLIFLMSCLDKQNILSHKQYVCSQKFKIRGAILIFEGVIRSKTPETKRSKNSIKFAIGYFQERISMNMSPVTHSPSRLQCNCFQVWPTVNNLALYRFSFQVRNICHRFQHLVNFLFSRFSNE